MCTLVSQRISETSVLVILSLPKDLTETKYWKDNPQLFVVFLQR